MHGRESFAAYFKMCTEWYGYNGYLNAECLIYLDLYNSSFEGNWVLLTALLHDPIAICCSLSINADNHLTFIWWIFRYESYCIHFMNYFYVVRLEWLKILNNLLRSSVFGVNASTVSEVFPIFHCASAKIERQTFQIQSVTEVDSLDFEMLSTGAADSE